MTETGRIYLLEKVQQHRRYRKCGFVEMPALQMRQVWFGIPFDGLDQPPSFNLVMPFIDCDPGSEIPSAHFLRCYIGRWFRRMGAILNHLRNHPAKLIYPLTGQIPYPVIRVSIRVESILEILLKYIQRNTPAYVSGSISHRAEKPLTNLVSQQFRSHKRVHDPQ